MGKCLVITYTELGKWHCSNSKIVILHKCLWNDAYRSCELYNKSLVLLKNFQSMKTLDVPINLPSS